ncbi:MAG: ParB/RepB/Spo0J family partition protein [Nitrospiraceae bacterium]|nr:MAG: ParB/RepB/Spo0J family partition protein [Nitrospiraceae bacterium]
MKPALGKGLSALIPDKGKGKAGEILELSTNAVMPNEYQPRRSFNDAALNELVASIKEKGVIQPVIVRKIADGSYQLIAGERRWRASRMAGLASIPAIVKEAAPEDALELALIENIQREDLNPLETAEAFHRLINDFSLTHDDISKKVGKDRATVTNYLRILKLPFEIKQWLAEGSLSIGHAKALLQADNPKLQIEIAGKVIKHGLSVRETEGLCRKGPSVKIQASKIKIRDPQIASLEEKMMHSLGTKVRLIHKSNKKGGKIEIDYYSLEELDRLLEILSG